MKPQGAHLPRIYEQILFFGGPCGTACGILGSWQEIILMLPALEEQNPNHWVAKEFPKTIFGCFFNIQP